MSDNPVEDNSPVEDIPEERPVWPLEPGRAIAVPVAMRDILPWTKANCTACQGTGVVRRTVMFKVENGRRINLPKSEYKSRRHLCECGLKRFRKVQKTHVEKGQLFAVEPWVAVHPETVEEAIAALEEQTTTQPQPEPPCDTSES